MALLSLSRQRLQCAAVSKSIRNLRALSALNLPSRPSQLLNPEPTLTSRNSSSGSNSVSSASSSRSTSRQTGLTGIQHRSLSTSARRTMSAAAAAPQEQLVSVNPRTGEKLRDYPEMSDAEILQILSEVNGVWRSNWGRHSKEVIDARCRVIGAVGGIIRERLDECSQMVADEMGKNFAEAQGEVTKCAGLCDYYSANGAGMLEPRATSTIAGCAKNYLVYQSLGTILSIMPWNFPMWQVIRMAIPNFVGGNAIVLKHAPNVNGTALLVEEIILEALRKEGAGGQEALGEEVFGKLMSGADGGRSASPFRTLLMPASTTEMVMKHPTIQGVSLTGSTRAGKAVAAMAGGLLKKCVVELGGCDGYVVLKDADLEKVADTVVRGRLLNTGQSCIGPKRVIIEESRKKEFEDLLVGKLQGKEFGKDFGVLVHKGAKNDVQSKVEQAVQDGARVVFGSANGGDAGVAGGSDAFYNPVVLSDVREGNFAFSEEIFGPVFSIVPCKDETQAIAYHNATEYGLGGAVFSGASESEVNRAISIAENELTTGMCFVNDFVRSDASMPFGGIKGSGFGRECGSEGVHEFMNLKHIGVAAAS